MTINYRLTVLAAAVAFACSSWAQQPSDQYQPDQYSAGQFQDASDQSAQTQVDPPTRVARLAYLSGEVSFAPAGENDWVSAQRNRPMTTGDKLYTDNGRAELQVGASSILLDARSNMDFLTLNDQMTQIELTQGAVSINVRRLRGGEVYEVDTPTIAFVADQVGSYRIDVDPNGQATTVSVTRGSGNAIGEGGARVRINEGEAIVFNDAQLSDYRQVALRSGDSFDNYARERIARYERAPARRYVSEEVVGYEDLDDSGEWADAPEYGHVWYPSGVAVDWAPYHDGNWVWQDPWGWTWVDNASWGFAPFHYGRWAYIGTRWGWIPGPVDVSPVYAPALVAFVGGGGFGIDISVGGPIGWFALGPRDVYFPGYRCGRDYFRDVNISNTVVNTTVVNNYYGAFSAGNVNYAQLNYANRMAPGAVTAVPTNAFVSGRPVAASAIAVNRTMLANARVLPRATVAPTAASLVASRGRATPPPAAAMNRTVVAANRPAAAPAPFAQRQALLRQNPGQPLTATQLRTVAAARPGANAPAAMTRSNVRVAGAAAGGIAAGAAAANARASANANAPANVRANAQAQGRAQGQLPSSRFTQQQRGNAQTTPPPRESATAQQNASQNARFNRGAAPPTTPANARANVQAQGRAQGQLPSSRYTQQSRGAPPRESATAQQNASQNARFSRGAAPPSTPANTRSEPQRAQAQAQQRGSASDQRMAQQQRALQQDRSSTQRMEAQNRAAEARANAQAQQRSSASEQRMAQQRAQQQDRASTQRMQAQNRAADARANANVQQHAQAQARVPQEQPQRAQAQRAPMPQREQAPVQQQRAQVQRAPMPQREQAPMQQQRAQVQRAPMPQREQAPMQQRAQAQYREPPRPTQQAPQQRQQQQAPQQRQQAKRKNEKDPNQQNGGG